MKFLKSALATIVLLLWIYLAQNASAVRHPAKIDVSTGTTDLITDSKRSNVVNQSIEVLVGSIAFSEAIRQTHHREVNSSDSDYIVDGYDQHYPWNSTSPESN
ncbi:hypothetical protein O6H91_12G062200 [Diphasiastrum complanatum]|uniref:Uncharacterized protein n=1 Tax=Diphasiastrum complanatum TaxID=34168 RepID=A0ACC2C2G4_DIPCM|nr:hypothetical protein O6H91_12G062200 [Diphasiastrum complanatum]